MENVSEGLAAFVGVCAVSSLVITPVAALAVTHYIPRARVWFDRNIIGRDSELWVEGNPHGGYVGKYVKGSKIRNTDKGDSGIRYL